MTRLNNPQPTASGRDRNKKARTFWCARILLPKLRIGNLQSPSNVSVRDANL